MVKFQLLIRKGNTKKNGKILCNMIHINTPTIIFIDSIKHYHFNNIPKTTKKPTPDKQWLAR